MIVPMTKDFVSSRLDERIPTIVIMATGIFLALAITRVPTVDL